MEFDINRNPKTKTAALIGANLCLCLFVGLTLALLGQSRENTDLLALTLEGASAVIAFLLFCVTARVQVNGVRMPILLAGLFLYQMGALFDAANEWRLVPIAHWLALSDVLRLGGELILALVAFQFVRLTARVANTDRLTELQNRSFHSRWIASYLNRSQHPLAVIAIDLDRFKAINDQHGHAFGDNVLKHVSRLLRQFMRGRRGIVSRTGGEEFEIALKNMSAADALQIAEALRQLIEHSPPTGLSRVTASIGVAISQPQESGQQLRKRADAAAYFSKQSGRNRVSLAGSDQTLNSIQPSA